MVRGKEKIIGYFLDNDAPYWTLYLFSSSDNKDKHVAKQEDIIGLGAETASANLERYMSYLEPGKYTLTCKKKYADAKNYCQTAIEITGEQISSANAIQSTQGTQNYISGFPMHVKDESGKPHVMLSQEMVADQIRKGNDDFKKELAAAEREKEFEALKKENADLKKDSLETVFARVLVNLEPVIKKFLPVIMQQVTPGTTAISGLNTTKPMGQANTTTPTLTEEEYSKQLHLAIQEWENLFPGDPLDVITKILDTAKANPDKYEMAKGFL